MILAISRSRPFRQLQSRIGSSTYRLNTILVGLENVAAGVGQTGAVAVTWTKPASPQKAKEVADQARIFACSAALVYAADILDTFVRDVVSERWMGFSTETHKIATKAVTRSKAEGGDYSVAERANAICNELGMSEPVKIAALDLLSKWRNAVVHGAERRPQLTQESRATLHGAATYLSEKYGHLDIHLAIRNFEQRAIPVPKEVTKLIAIAVNLSRAIDEAAIRRVASTEAAVSVSAEAMILDYFRHDDTRQVRPWAEISEIWQGGKDRRNNLLKKVVANFGITETTTPVSAPLPAHFLDELVRLDKVAFARRFEISRD